MSHKAMADQFFGAINSGNLDALDGLIADDFVEHDEVPGIPQTKAGVRMFFEALRSAFPDLHVTKEHLVEEGDLLTVFARMTGTHQGEFMGMPATGRTISVPFADLVRFSDGKAVEHWGVTDSGMMMQQLGGADVSAATA